MTYTTDYDLGKRQTRPLLREGAPHRQNRNSLTVKQNLVLGPRWGLTLASSWASCRQ
jgi:hypothetical protein